MDNKQLAHDLAIARMAGTQLAADILVDEYKKNYSEILSYLQSQASGPVTAKITNSPV